MRGPGSKDPGPFFIPGSCLAQTPAQKVQPVLAPEDLTLHDIARRAKYADAEGLLRVALVGGALDWVLDQHKERKPKDPTIREKFDTYRFADHKERVIDLLARVARVSVETVDIVAAMKAAPR